MNALIWRIALKYLSSSRRRGVISLTAGFSLIGIALGVAALIVVMAVMNGYRQELIRLTTGFNGHISVYDYEGMEDYVNLADELSKIAGVVELVPQIERQVMLTAAGKSMGVNLHGVSAESLANKTVIAGNIIEGSIEEFSASDQAGIVIGRYLAIKLGVGIGDSLRIITSNTRSTLIGGIPRMVEVPVIAMFESGMSLYDTTNVYVPLALTQKMFNYGGKVDQVEISVSNPERLDYYLDYLRVLHPSRQVITWKESNAQILQALEIEKAVMFIILTLIITVAAFNIISSLAMLVNFKRKEIAILRTMGMSKRQVMYIFALTGLLIGVIGTVIGSVGGYLFATNIDTIRQFLNSRVGLSLFDPLVYYLSLLPAKIMPYDLLKISAMSLLLSLLAAIYPARQAAKLNPAMVVKYD